MIGDEPLRRAVVDKSLVKQPLDGPTLGSDIAQRVPRRDQIRMVFVDLALESAERSSSLQRMSQLATGYGVADAIGKVSHVLQPHRSRQRVDEDEIELVSQSRADLIKIDFGKIEHPLRVGPESDSLGGSAATRPRSLSPLGMG